MQYLYNKSPDELREIYKTYPYPHAVGKAVLHHKDTPLDVLLNNTHCSGIVNSIYLPLEVYEKILVENHKSILSLACRISHTPSIVLEKIFKLYKDDVEVQYDLCRNSNSDISADTLHELSKSISWEVRSCVAKHKHTDIRDIVLLQQDAEPRVLMSLRERFEKDGILQSKDKTNWRDIPLLKIA